MKLRPTDRAYGDLEAVIKRPRDYANVSAAVKAIGGVGPPPGGKPIAVVNDQYDVYTYEPPGTGSTVIVLIWDPDDPGTAVFAGLWPDPDGSRRATKRVAAEAASAAGVVDPRVFVSG